MTKEDKQLLIKDLCARLPFGVILDNPNPCGEHWDELISMDIPQGTVTLLYDGRTYKVEKVKPYLRPMSSMTEEELLEQRTYKKDIMYRGFGTIELYMSWYIEWLDSKHFDWRKDGNGKTLIEKGLALEAPEGMYKTE